MNVLQDFTSKFMLKFGQWDGESYLSSPKPKNQDELNTYKLRLKLCIEETFELFEAMLTPEAYKSYEDLLQTLNNNIESLTVAEINVDPIGVYDSLVDQQVVNDGFANLLGLDMYAGMQEVYASNMSKLGEDGKPVYREDGKVMKNLTTYIPPDLAKIYKNVRYSYKL